VDLAAVDLGTWVPFFTAAAGASAALVGLLIVAMSVNVESIVKIASMPSRAAATISSLSIVVVISVLALIPGLGARWLGVVVLVCALGAVGFAVDSMVRLLRDAQGHTEITTPLERVLRAIVGVIPVVVCAVGGVLLLIGVAGAGLVLTAVGFALAFLVAVLNTWVILIEIRR
jgi:modulator of FtsH protease